MLLLLRFFPFLTVLVLAAGSLLLFWSKANSVIIILATCLFLFFLLSKLAGWAWRKVDFWVLFGVPYFFILSFLAFLLFLETDGIKIVTVILGLLLLWLFTENLFHFNYLPGVYQVNALEYLSLVINVTGVFFVTASLLAGKLFLGLPLWFLLLIFCLISFGLLASTFWICKFERAKIIRLALGGTVLVGEMFLVLSWLPVSFFANAAFLTIFFYLFFGLLRAHFFGKLSHAVHRRYILAAFCLTIIVIVTARWM